MDRVDSTYLAQGRALVCDDDVTGRLTLRGLLRRRGFEVIEATNGVEAVEKFTTERPDIVFMDVMMPVMNGLEAATRIKAIAAETFVPIIFVTGASAEADFVQCLNAGGDDFLVKPFSQAVLSAKIGAMARIRDLQARAGAMYAQIQHDQAMAKSVFSGAVMGQNVMPEALHTALLPASTFSGDLVLTAYAPSGDLYVLFGDFTGHGLAAALGALPTAEVFRAMTTKGFAPSQILASINTKLRQLLPVGMFLAATFVHVARSLDLVSVCNCGMPEAWVLDGARIRHRVASAGLPLAITDKQDFESMFEVMPGAAGLSVFLASDGVFEACSVTQEQYGSARVEAAIAIADADSAVQAVVQGLNDFRGEAPLLDDVSLAQVSLVPGLFPQAGTIPSASGNARADAPDAGTGRHQNEGWCVKLELRASTLRRSDPVPMLLSQMQEFSPLGEDRAALYTVVTELFCNALDHGLLRLGSEIKSDAAGFTQYVEERHRRLDALVDGVVTLSAEFAMTNEGPEYTITVEDTGQGFDERRLVRPDGAAPHGRGIPIVRGLCCALRFEAGGRRAIAVYRGRATGAPQ